MTVKVENVVVVDASVALAFVFPDEKHHTQAVALFTHWGKEGVAMMTTTLFENETDSVIRLRVAVKKLLKPEAESVALSVLDSLPVAIEREVLTGEKTRLVARQLAQRFEQPRCYDSAYLALAQVKGATLWTADERLFNSVAGKDVPKAKALAFVRFLGNFKP